MANYEMNITTKKGWTKQPNAILRDKDLTSDAFKVISFLLSIRGDYTISMKGISKTINLSESKVKRAVDLLQSTGYLQIVKVRNGKLYGGYVWRISDIPGVYRKCTDEISNHDISISENSMHDISNHDISNHETSMDVPLYQGTNNYQQMNNQQTENQHTEWDEGPLHQPDVEEAEAAPLPPNNPSSFTESSSVANAPSPASKNTGSGEQVMTQREFEFQQFLKKYPKAPLARELEDTRREFFEATGLDGSFAEIMAGLDAWCDSVEWHKDNGRWIKKPLNWLKERQWQKANIAETLSEVYFDNLFSTEEA